MAGFTDYLENALLDHVFGGGSDNYTAPSNIYIALLNTVPTDDAGTGLVEPTSGVNYERKSTTSADWETASAGTISNTEIILFNTIGAGGWGTLNGFGLFDDLTAGNLLMFGTFSFPIVAEENLAISFASGELVISLD